MSVLSSVLQVKPSTWDSMQLPSGKNFVLIPLLKGSEEYDEVQRILISEGKSCSGIKQIKRVQHPFAYGRYLLRKEQLKLRNGHNIQEKVIISVLENKVDLFLEHNLDIRRHSVGHNTFIIAKCLRSSFNAIKRDSEVYPEYVVYYS